MVQDLTQHASDAAETRLVLQAEHTGYLYQQALGSIIAAPVPWILLALLMWPLAGGASVTWSLLMLLAATLVQLIVTLVFRYLQPPREHHRRWLYMQITAIALVGSAWGASGIILHMPGDITSQAMMLLFLGAMAAVVLVAYAAVPAAYLCFVLPMCTPIVILLLFNADQTENILGLALASYVAILTLYMVQAHRVISQAFRLRHENRELITHLLEARGQTEQANSQLRKTNRELSDAVARVREIAAQDDLTGLPNRRYLMQALETELARCERAGECFCVCLIDIDHFKQVNDTLGHIAGDDVLRAFAARVLEDVRGEDIFGRFGGEEFLFILPGATLAGATQRAERLRQLVGGNKLLAGEHSLELTISIGIAEYRQGETRNDLLARCDKALYKAKAQGRNRVIAAA